MLTQRAEISAAEMRATLKKIEARGALETFKCVRQRARDIFLYAMATARAENRSSGNLCPPAGAGRQARP